MHHHLQLTRTRRRTRQARGENRSASDLLSAIRAKDPGCALLVAVERDDADRAMPEFEGELPEDGSPAQAFVTSDRP